MSYSSLASSAWTGAGILSKPIGDFHAGTFNSSGTAPRFALSDNVQTIVHNQIIPEPEEYALVFGLFALGFVLCLRRRQPKKQRQ